MHLARLLRLGANWPGEKIAGLVTSFCPRGFFRPNSYAPGICSRKCDGTCSGLMSGGLTVASGPGALPMTAIRYQIVVIFMLAVATALGSLIFVRLAVARYLTPAHQLLRHAVIGGALLGQASPKKERARAWRVLRARALSTLMPTSRPAPAPPGVG